MPTGIAQIEQGHGLGRPSALVVDVRVPGDGPVGVSLSGRCALAMTGTLRLP